MMLGYNTIEPLPHANNHQQLKEKNQQQDSRWLKNLVQL